MNPYTINAVIPITFDLSELKNKYNNLLEGRVKSNRHQSACFHDNNTYCCKHQATFSFPARGIINETELPNLRRYATLAAYAPTNCVNYEITQALFNIGIFFEGEQFLIWQELFFLGRYDEAVWFEHAVCQETDSIHPNFQGVVYDNQRLLAAKKFTHRKLSKIYKEQDKQDSIIDNELDQARFNKQVEIYNKTADERSYLEGSFINPKDTDLRKYLDQ